MPTMITTTALLRRFFVRAGVPGLAVGLIMIGGLATFYPAHADGCDGPDYGALDFWIGDWVVESSSGERLGSATIRKELGGCLLSEEWVGKDGGTALNYMYWDPVADGWRLRAFTDRGGQLALELEPARRREGAAVVRDGWTFRGELFEPGQSARGVRGTLQEDARGVALDFETVVMRRGWEPLLNLRYRRAGSVVTQGSGARPGRPEEDARPGAAGDARDSARPLERPAAKSGRATADRAGVRARSRAVGDGPVELESPMVLEFELGEVEGMPAGYGWSTRELERFTSAEARIPRVIAEMTGRRSRRQLTVTLQLVSTRYAGQYSLALDLLPPATVGDRPAASVPAQIARAGRGIPRQADTGYVPVKLTFDLDATEWKELLALGTPRLRVTLVDVEGGR